MELQHTMFSARHIKESVDAGSLDPQRIFVTDSMYEEATEKMFEFEARYVTSKSIASDFGILCVLLVVVVAGLVFKLYFYA